MTNAVNKAKPDDLVLLHVARKPTGIELANLRTSLGDDVFEKVTVVSDLVEVYSAVKSTFD